MTDRRVARVAVRIRQVLIAVVVGLAISAPRIALADENYFGYAYGAETLPKGKSEAYVWLTSRIGKGVGSYSAIDNYNELEHGLTDRLQLSLYLNTSAHRIKNNPEWEDNSSFGFEGARTSFKYALTSPFKSPLGIALYVEPEYSRRDKVSGEHKTELAVEAKVILQKNFLEDRMVSVLNLTYEHEFEREPGEDEQEWEQEIALEGTAGLSYRFMPNWFLGGEARTHSEYPDADLGHEEHRAWFLGPNIHYGGQKWWFTLTVLPQIYGRPHENSDHLFLGEHERVETRFKIGYNF